MASNHVKVKRKWNAKHAEFSALNAETPDIVDTAIENLPDDMKDFKLSD